jgi:hypothetical protein
MIPLSAYCRALGAVLATAAPCSAQRGGPIDADALPLISARQDLRIGSRDDPKVGFSAIAAFAVDRDGQMFVYDRRQNEIRVLGVDGRLVRTIGRAGQGPGEFNRIASLGVTGDTVWAFDDFTLRILLYRRNGTPIATRTMPAIPVAPLHDASLARMMPYALRPDGRFVGYIGQHIAAGDLTERMARAAGVTNTVKATDTVMVPRLLFSATGVVADTIGWEPVPPRDAPTVPTPVTTLPNGQQQYGIYVEGGGGRFSVPQPPTEYYIRTSTNDGSALVTRRRATRAQPAEFEFVRFDMAGKIAHRLRFRYAPRRYTGAVLDTIAMRPVAARPPQSPEAAFKAVRAALKFPEFQAGVYAIWGANDGSVWLRREDNAGPRHRWIAIERSGTVRGVVELPRVVNPIWSDGEKLIGIETDDVGVPWLVRYVMQRAP